MTKTKQSNLKRKRNLKDGEIIPLWLDDAFKIMFSKIEVLTMLLGKILEVDYEKLEGRVELAPSRIPNRTVGEAKMERDLVVRIKDNPERRLVMEVNIKKKFYQSVIDRNLHYLNQVSTNGMEEGKSYSDMPMSLLINFNDFFVDEEHKKVFDSYLYRNKEGHVLSHMQEIININIAECYRLWYNKEYQGKFGEFQEDLLLIASSMMIEKHNEFTECIGEVRTKLTIKDLMERTVDEMKDDEMLWGRLYIREEEDARIREGIIAEERANARKEAFKEGFDDGFNDGFNDGSSKTRKEIIKKMIEKDMPLEIISEISGVSLEEVENIINN